MAAAVKAIFAGATLYEVLGVDKTATAEQLKRGYLKKALLWVGGTMSSGRAWRCRESRARRWW